MKYARSENNIVVQVIGNDPARLFSPEHAALFRACSANVEAGWLYDGTNYTAPPAPPLAEQKAETWERIKAHREALSDEGGYKVVVGGVDKWFHSDAKSKTQQISLVMMGASVVAVPPWKTMNGSKVTMTQALAGQIFTAAVTQDGAIFAAAEAHRAAMEASANPSAYGFSSGWPATFGGV